MKLTIRTNWTSVVSGLSVVNLCFLLLLFSLASCSDSILDADVCVENNAMQEPEGNVVYPRLQQKRHKAKSAYGASTNWESWETVPLASGQEVTVPWAKNYYGGAIPIDIARDIKVENGWELIAHTFKVNRDPGLNYLVFHNLYTGILKVFCYVEKEQVALQNNAIWQIKINKPHACFNFQERMATPVSNKTTKPLYVGNLTNDPTKGFTLGWNCFQVELAYDPDLLSENMTEDVSLIFTPYSRNISSITLSGTTTLETNGLLVSTTNSNILSKPVKGIAKYVGGAAENVVKDMIGTNKFWGIPASTIVSGAGSIVETGINRLLGSFIGGFNKSNETTQSIQLTTNGTFNIEGNVEAIQTGMVQPLTLSLHPETTGYLGTWGMWKMPCVKLNPYALYCEPIYYTPPIPEYEIHVMFDGTCTGSVTLNPDLRERIKRDNSEYEISHMLYETDTVTRQNALNVPGGGSGAIFNGSNKRQTQTKLAEHVYTARRSLFVSIGLVGEDGFVIDYEDVDPPIEIFIPDAPDGTKGARDYLTFSSQYILAKTISITTGNGNTFVSTHTFSPEAEWNYGYFNDGIYKEIYPSVPAERKKTGYWQ